MADTPAKERVVLIAEDDDMTRKLAAVVVESIGYKTIGCENGKVCIEMLQQIARPSLLLLDLQMPLMDGFAVLDRIKKSGLMETFPIVVFTADKQQETVVRAMQAGAHDYVIKPFQPKNLAQRITDLVFDVGEADVRALIGNLRMRDPSLFRMHGLRPWDNGEYDAYAATHADKSVCVLLPNGIGPASLVKASMLELATKVHVFRKCTYGYRKVWPTYSVLFPP